MPEEKGKKEIKWEHFPIGKRGVRIWSDANGDAAREFLEGVNPTFFWHLAGVHQRALREAGNDEQAKMDAALGIRVSYGMGLEALMAFLCATVQAPHCVYGWLSLYTNRDLREVVAAVHKGELVLADRMFRPGPVSWTSVASAIFAPLEAEHPDTFKTAVERHARAWGTLAEGFLNQHSRDEYNAIKHGLRTRPGAGEVQIAPEGVEPLRMTIPYANRFPVISEKRNTEGKRRKCHYDVTVTMVSLEPEWCVAALGIITQSLRNLRNALVVASGYSNEYRFEQLEPADVVFGALEKRESDLASLTWGTTTEAAEEEYLSSEEILALWEEAQRGNESGD